MLAEIARPLPVCADESCHDRATLAGLTGKYDVVNIKLDKTGGLTEALALKAEARGAGLPDHGRLHGRLVLAMAPAVLLAQGADWTDLDGPLLLAEDRDRAAASTTRPACIRPRRRSGGKAARPASAAPSPRPSPPRGEGGAGGG